MEAPSIVRKNKQNIRVKHFGMLGDYEGNSKECG